MKVNKETIARTICLALALINQILAILGKGTIDIADDVIYQFVTLAFTISASLIAWWKNNDLTPEARAGSAYMRKLKAQRNISGGTNDINDETGHADADPEIEV